MTCIILFDFLHNGYSALHNCCDKDCCNLSILCLWYFCSLVKSFVDKSTHASWEVFLSDMSDCFGWILVSCLIIAYCFILHKKRHNRFFTFTGKTLVLMLTNANNSPNFISSLEQRLNTDNLNGGVITNICEAIGSKQYSVMKCLDCVLKVWYFPWWNQTVVKHYLINKVNI